MLKCASIDFAVVGSPAKVNEGYQLPDICETPGGPKAWRCSGRSDRRIGLHLPVHARGLKLVGHDWVDEEALGVAWVVMFWFAN